MTQGDVEERFTSGDRSEILMQVPETDSSTHTIGNLPPHCPDEDLSCDADVR